MDLSFTCLFLSDALYCTGGKFEPCQKPVNPGILINFIDDSKESDFYECYLRVVLKKDKKNTRQQPGDPFVGNFHPWLIEGIAILLFSLIGNR